MKATRIWTWLMALWVLTGPLDAANILPKQVLQQLVTTVQHHVDAHSRSHMAVLVKKIDPFIDAKRIAQGVAGRAAWRHATPVQRQQFVQALERRMTSHYLQRLADLKGSKILLRAVPPKPSDRYAQVVMFVTHPNGGVDECMVYFRKVGHSWKVIDFHYNHLSIMQQLKETYQPLIEQHGLKNLSNDLMEG